MTRLRDQRGEVSLTELLVAAVLMLIVGSAALLGMETFRRVEHTTTQRNDAQDHARAALDRMSRQLRNLASPTPSQPQAVDRATPYDAIFQTVDPVGPNAGTNATNVERVRWCLDAGTPTAKLWMQRQTWTTALPPAVPSSTACPAPTGGGANWADAQVVAEHVVNRRDGLDRPLFSFNSATPTDISALHADVVIDRDPGAGAAETRLSTGVYLRNQNRRPTAAFTATRSAQGIVLNGSLSSDPEADGLRFQWYVGGTAIDGADEVVYTMPATAGQSYSIKLVVEDSAGLDGSTTQVVTG
ncbi:MAG TPA: hypothetical protein VD931_20650 [Baekduia sp.]|nr:hypothetical protein [Baekduia sp.]